MHKLFKKGAFYQSVKRELIRMTSRRLYLGYCIILPLFCVFFMNTIFGTGEMEHIPIGIVDLDQTATSRQICRTLSTVPTTEVTNYYSDPLEARNAVLKKEIYAYVVIPNNLESNLLGGRDASIPYYIHYALLSVGVEVEAALETVFADISLAPVVVAGTSFGTSTTQLESVILPVSFEAHPLFNPALDYSIYLTNPFFFVLFQVIILLVTMYVLGSEIKFKTSDDWLKTANMNIFIAVTAKLLPYTVIYIIMGIFANFVMFNILHIPMEAGFMSINFSTALFIISTQAFGVFIFSLFPALSLVMSVASMIGSLGATLSGVTFPVFSMHPIIYYMSFLFPVRHFVLINQNILYGNYGLEYVWQSIACLMIFVLLALLILPHLKKATLSHKYEDIE